MTNKDSLINVLVKGFTKFSIEGILSNVTSLFLNYFNTLEHNHIL